MKDIDWNAINLSGFRFVTYIRGDPGERRRFTFSQDTSYRKQIPAPEFTKGKYTKSKGQSHSILTIQSTGSHNITQFSAQQ